MDGNDLQQYEYVKSMIDREKFFMKPYGDRILVKNESGMIMDFYRWSWSIISCVVTMPVNPVDELNNLPRSNKYDIDYNVNYFCISSLVI